MALLICILTFQIAHQIALIVFFDPKNMGVETIILPLSVILTELYLNIHLLAMAAHICIKMALETFFQLVNIANRFLRVFFQARYTN